MEKITFKGSPELSGIQVITIHHPHSHVECAILLHGIERLRLALLPEGMCALLRADECPDGVVLEAFASLLAEHIRYCGTTTLEPAVEVVSAVSVDEVPLTDGSMTTNDTVVHTSYTALSGAGASALVVTTRRTLSTVLVSAARLPEILAQAIALAVWRHQRGNAPQPDVTDDV